MKFGNWWNRGAPWVWLNAGAISISIIMVFGLLALILVRGFGHFWPHSLIEADYAMPGQAEQVILGQLRKSETLTAQNLREAGVPLPEEQLLVTRHLFKLANRDVNNRDFAYFVD